MLLKNRTILITGASTGIGQGIALALAQDGAKLAVTSRSHERLADTMSLLKQADAAFITAALDVTDEDQIIDVINRVNNEFGRLDGLVNNAGIFLPEKSLEATYENFSSQLDTNLIGLMLCCKNAAKIMRTQKDGGKIVNIASNAGKVGFPLYAAYSATKAGVIRLTQTLANEWAKDNINVNAVCPGGVETPMLHAVADFISQETKGNSQEIFETLVPPQLGRHITAFEVGKVVAMLLSDYAEIIRGQSISIDGGETPF